MSILFWLLLIWWLSNATLNFWHSQSIQIISIYWGQHLWTVIQRGIKDIITYTYFFFFLFHFLLQDRNILRLFVLFVASQMAVSESNSRCLQNNHHTFTSELQKTFVWHCEVHLKKGISGKKCARIGLHERFCVFEYENLVKMGKGVRAWGLKMKNLLSTVKAVPAILK